MMRRDAAYAVLGMLALLRSAPASADMFRCGSKVISEADTPTEIEAKCGTPLSKSRRTEPVRVRQANGTMRIAGETTIEE